jgi:ferredoxin-NADP reductase
VARTAVPGRLNWLAAEVIAVVEETRQVHSLVLRVPGWNGHLPGQHVDVRLTAEDGYQAQRSYSIATPADGDRITLTVERVEGGEVSPFLVEELKLGDQFELRGPIGGYFVWEPAIGGPLQLVAGGSGVVPLMAMTRSLTTSDSSIPARLLLSTRSWEDVIYREELERLRKEPPALEVTYTITRAQPPGWTGYARRVDPAMLSEVAWPASEQPLVFVCGPTGFVETVASTLLDMGHPPERVKTERFGPTGG